MTDLVRISLPGKGAGFTLRQPSRWLRPDYAEFLADGERVWLFREFDQLQGFLASDLRPAPYWRELLEADGRELVPDSATQYNLFRMVDGHLRWSDGHESLPCMDLCVELAFACGSWELLDTLGPRLHGPEVGDWRRIIHLLVPMFRFWNEAVRSDEAIGSDQAVGTNEAIGPSEADEPVTPEVIGWAMNVSFHHGP